MADNLMGSFIASVKCDSCYLHVYFINLNFHMALSNYKGLRIVKEHLE